MDEDAEIQSLRALLADEEPRVLKAIEDTRKPLASARASVTRLKKSKAKNKTEARATAKARLFELELPLRDQEALAEKRKRLLALESEKARRIRLEEVARGKEHNARVPTFLKLPRNVLGDILYQAMLQTQEIEGSCLCSHKTNSRIRKPWEVRVMSVCKALHEHVVASPAMWTFISKAVSGSSRAIQTYISRSGCMKLHVSLKVCSRRMEDLSGYDPRFALLARNIHRIQVLCISCDGYKALNVATIPFHRLTAPSLVRLHLSFNVQEDQLYLQEEDFNIPTTSDDDDDFPEFPLPDAKGAAALEAGIVLVAKAPVLSTVSIDNGYFARDLPFLAKVKTFCLTHDVSYVPDMECEDAEYLGTVMD
ncbi:hypothetical protein BDZ89DRAFT_730468 [Hymenopellis radicata]|nr:hypothetical protein BDZ89DRAFT_730468 [Hymenopellis radicata]